MNADIDCCSVGLLSLNALNVNNKLLTVHLHHFAHLLAFEVTANHLPNTVDRRNL